MTTSLWLLPAGAQTLDAAVGQVEWESGRTLADELPGRILSLLQEQGKGLGDLTGLIIFSGPGSFTSLRIAHAVANALADSLSLPVAGATGDDWARTALAALKDSPGQIVLPEYGGDANITTRRR